MNLPINGIRLWKYDVVYGKDVGFTTALESHRPRTLVSYQHEDIMISASSVLEPKGDNIFYVETGKPVPVPISGEIVSQPHLMLSPYDRETSILAFIKLYEPGRRKFTYTGSLIFSLDDPITKYYPEINALAGLQRDAKLNLYLVSLILKRYIAFLGSCSRSHLSNMRF